jgi:DNA polymerase III delta subunit
LSTFSSWWNSFKKNPTPRQITWVCGTEPILVDEVVDTIRAAIQVDAINLSYLDAREVTERFIWNELRQYPFGPQSARLTIVKGAEKIKDESDFIQYIKDRGALPRNYVIFVSDEPALRKVEDSRETWSPLEFLKTRGSLIECRPFTSATAKYAVEWVKLKANIRGRVAEHLLNRSAGDLRLVRDTIRKLNVFPDEASLRDVDEMFDDRPADNFISAIFALDKKTAIAALKEIPQGEYSLTLGQVDARLDLAGQVHDMLIEQKSRGEIARAAGTRGFLVPEILPVAKHYDKKRRQRIRNYLAIVDTYSDRGVPTGALEALIAIW